VVIDLGRGREVTAEFRNPKTPRTVAALKSALQSTLPSRLAARWAELHAPDAWTNHALADFERQLHAWQLSPSGTEGYEKAEVTAGGVDTTNCTREYGEPKNSGIIFLSGKWWT